MIAFSSQFAYMRSGTLEKRFYVKPSNLEKQPDQPAVKSFSLFCL
ncbi:hypothetical protein CHCC20335_0842 [Bacillus paralicheniformis]|nr:hypothetical protein CHCC20335_0842 [Bacillus paralicheniformis]